MSNNLIDSRVLSTLIMELNISLRSSRAYPKGHQVIDAALNKVLSTYATLQEPGGEAVIGVACDALLLGDVPLEKSNLVYRDFARVLYERGIGALVLHRGLGIEELRSFISILGAKREEIYSAGGIESVWEKSGIASIKIRAIRYDAFVGTEEASIGKASGEAGLKGLWERFARSLVIGLVPAGEIAEPSLNPESLAETLNRQFLASEGSESGDTLDIADYLRNFDIYQGWEPGAEAQADLAYHKLASFVAKLTPELRRQFLNSTFDSKKISSESATEGFIRQLPADVIIEALEDINQDRQSVPSFVLALLQQMSSHASPDGSQPAPEMTEQVLHDKLRTIFKEQSVEQFTPESYQHKLNRMMSADQIPTLGLEGVHDLMETFETASIESKTSDILILLLSLGASSEEGYATLARNLHEICAYFSHSGDYGQLLKILRQIQGSSIPDEARAGLLEPFLQTGFLEEVLDGMETWGKVRFSEIAELVREIGPPFIEVILDRLEDADSISLRRFLMDRLVEFGPAAGPAITERLSDSRWYYLRNLISVIRAAHLTSTLEKLRPLASHRDPRVSREALMALLQFHDPEAESRIMRDLENENREVKLAAIRMAGRSSSAAVVGKLHAILAGSGLSVKDYEVKKLVVQALAEIGNVLSLAVLDRLLASRNIFHPVLSGKLKLDVLESLVRYPAPASSILARIAQGRGNLALQASRIINTFPGRVA